MLISSSQEPEIHYRCRANLKHLLWMLDDSSYDPENRAPRCSLPICQNSQQGILGTKELVQDSSLPSHDSPTKYFNSRSKPGRKRIFLNKSTRGHEINKIVAVALAAISRDHCNRSSFQHALKTFHCYAQDLDYKPVDKAVLGEHGIEVIDDPSAWLKVGERSILFSCGPNVPVKEIVADIARPAVNRSVLPSGQGHDGGL
ncbi:hypothetical protein NUU61_005055 [Penicillium alfredii]|uniref:Uncharacterized protein n=1 Tax=Penicillium alfredii TaxID=1506179 RepID=A0A9W9K789_9EURO|nr:uncharacterized protein NUU61_005055 [Penicillium alfredii]KAJ5095699.1 hypothetical protein NUU61_005055 [Penicillium alfredii]